MTIAFLVAKDRESAAEYAASRGWVRIALERFAGTDKEDIRYADTANHMVTGGYRGLKVYRAPSYEERDEMTKIRFEKLIEDGTAVWADA